MVVTLDGLSAPLLARLEAMRAQVRVLAEPYTDKTHRRIEPVVDLAVVFHGPKGQVRVVVTARVVKPAPLERVVFELAEGEVADEGDLYQLLLGRVNAASLSWEAFLVGVCRG